jgi:hypothetical protein
VARSPSLGLLDLSEMAYASYPSLRVAVLIASPRRTDMLSVTRIGEPS